MSVDRKQHGDTNSREFEEGVEAGRNSRETGPNGKPWNELGQGLKEEGVNKAPLDGNTIKKYPTPLFIKESSTGRMANLQDEKDETEE